MDGTYEGKKSTDKWFPVRLVDATDLYSPEESIAFGSVTAVYGYEAATSETSYTVTTDDWKEQGSGNYWLRIGASEFANEGKYMVNIEATGCHPNNFIVEVRDKTVAELIDDVVAVLADTNELQTNQGNWLTATSVGLNDDAITSAKFDESTAFPLASADSGATQIARTGADSDTLETLSDQLDAVPTASEIQAEMEENGASILDSISDKLPTNYIMGSSVQTAMDDEIDAIKAVTDNLPNAGALTDIDTGVNNIEAKLPTNYIMGSSVVTDKDDEIDAIKTVTDNLPNAGALTDIDTGINNIEAKLPSKNYLAGTANSDGDVQMDEATGNFPGSVASVAGAVGSVSGNVGGNVTGSIGSLAAQAKLDVNAEADTALSDYDPPTKTEMDTAHALLATPAQVNAQVLDVLNTDTFGEPAQGDPPVSTTIFTKIGFLYKFMRNKIYTTTTQISVYDDAGTTVDHKSTISGSSSEFTRGEFVSGP